MGRACCVMFAGQSVQESGMCRRLWELPAAREVLERLKPCLGGDLEHVTTEMPEAELALTFNTQRAIHAHHLGHWLAYRARCPDVVLDGAIGHSMGVVAALVAAGSLSVEDSGVFIRARARSFADVCGRAAGPLGLATVASRDLAAVLPELAAFPRLKLALRNTLRRAVVGGPAADLEAFGRKAAEQGWPVMVSPLKVEGPYHTEAFTPCRQALAEALACVTVRPPEVPVFMGTSGKAETDPERIKALLVDQVDSCERHLDAVRAAYAHGCREFLEVAHRPQPVTWLSDQLKGEDGAPLPGYTGTAVRTEELFEGMVRPGA
ncbi:MAG: ACP S-malonyltransferase [Elusimicrobiota bacterium]